MSTTAVGLVQRLNQHRAWVNSNLLAAAKELSNDQLHQTFAIGQGTVWKSLVHMFAAEYVWLAALQGNPDPLAPGDLPGHIPGNQLSDRKIASLDELKSKWTELAVNWSAYLAELKPESLDDTVVKVNSQGVKMVTRRSDILLHVCTHAQHTTAQTLNMFRHLGVQKLPDTMLIAFARQEAKSQPQMA